MSDEEDFEDTGSSGGDFSDNSEDDWKPSKESEEESEFESSSPDKRTPIAIKKKPESKNRAKPGPTRNGKVMSASLRELLEAAKAKKREKMNLSEAGPSKAQEKSPVKTKSPAKLPSTYQDSEDSSSSGDENLVNPSHLDLGSSFFQPVQVAPIKNRTPTPNFDCNIGLGSLSDSDEEIEETADEDNDNDASTGNLSNLPAVDVMENLRNFNQNLDDAKENLRKYEANNSSKATTVDPILDVNSLLALGETGASEKGIVKVENPTAKRRPKKKQEESGESDWEEVEAVKPEQKPSLPENVDVILELPDGRRAKLQNDLEVALKRQLNKEKREQQLQVHQAGLKEWLEQGNYINGILNDATLFRVALQMLPSAQAYPKDKADLKYLEQITKWYTGTVKVAAGADMYPPLMDDLDMKASLRKQIEAKAANSKRDFVLIFIVLLRAIGCQCRMVVNLVLAPIRPPQSELCRITSNPKTTAAAKSSGGKKGTRGKKKEETSDDEDDDDFDKIAERLSKSPKKEERKRGDSSKRSEKRSKKSSKDDPSTSVANDSKASSSKEREAATKSESKDSSTSSTSEQKAKKVDPSEAKTPKSSSSKRAANSKKTEEKVKAVPLPRVRATRSRAQAVTQTTLDIPQMDGLDDNVIASPIGKRTRSRSKTPVNSAPPRLLKKVLVAKDSVNSPIKSKRRNNNNTLKVPGTEELFSVDPTEKKTIPKPRKSASRNIQKEAVTAKPPRRPAAATVEDDSDAPPKKSPRISIIDRRVLSTDDDDNDDAATKKPPTSSKTDFWLEVWAEQEEKWMCLDLFKKKVNAPETIIRSATVPIAYVLAWGNNSTVKDVSLRYCPQWHSVNKKLRTDEAFIEGVLKPFVGVDTERDRKEAEELQRLVMDRPMPTSISEFKNHPLYALKRHLLKFEAIYPPNPPTLGFVRGEEVYARECVHVLHSRELWVKQARVVKLGETPYKVVKARPKWERATNTVIKDLPLELFGVWQTGEYEPPVAENGIVPKNAYGNVELFKACMLPINTVHLPYPGLNKVCKRLRIDYAPAMVGFDFHSGYTHPVYEGYVVCKEFAELVTDEWVKDTEEAEKRQQEKFQERVYGNWKRLIKGLFIRKRLQLRYNFEGEEEEEEEKDVSAQDVSSN